MKNLVLTIAQGELYQSMGVITHPSIKAYAEKIGADFKVIDEQKIAKTTPHWEKFQIHDLLDEYERIIYIDTDIIIREDCPDMFGFVSPYSLGMFNEAPFTERSKEMMIDICKSYDVKLESWNGKYYNSGVMVISKIHKELFKKPEKEVFNFYEQSYINMKIAEMGVEVQEIAHNFNRMSCMDVVTGEDRHASWVIHYAGYPNRSGLFELIRHDLKIWEECKGEYNFKRHLHIKVSGGLGDQMNAEPSIRFMKELCKGDDIIVSTHFPRLFKHLEGKDLRVYKHGQVEIRPDTPYYLMESFPDTKSIQWAVVSNLLCHTVDFVAMSLLKRTLPLEDRTMKISVGEQDYKGLYEKLGFEDFKDYVLVHAGRHWESKTFPKEYWQEIIDKLGEKVILIGKTEDGDPPHYVRGARGTVELESSKVIDMRDKLELGELFALIKEAKVLISNDSAPVHIAGAFDNWIILIPSCKHPDHILPYRNKQNYYKAFAPFKDLPLNDCESRPYILQEVSGEKCKRGWGEYLPAVDEVIECVNLCK